MINRKRLASFAEVEVAASGCGVRLIPHAEVVRCAEEATRVVDRALSAAESRGALNTVNEAYRSHREAAAARGERTPGYSG